MIAGSVLALFGALVATLLRRTRLEETAWKATLVAMIAAPLLSCGKPIASPATA